jgi:hypothetical protein
MFIPASWRHMTDCYNIHALLHGFIYRSFLYSHSRPNTNLTCRIAAIWCCWVVLYAPCSTTSLASSHISQRTRSLIGIKFFVGISTYLTENTTLLYCSSNHYNSVNMAIPLVSITKFHTATDHHSESKLHSLRCSFKISQFCKRLYYRILNTCKCISLMPIPVAARSKAWVSGRSLSTVFSTVTCCTGL